MLNNKTVSVCGKVYSVVGHKLNRNCLGGFLTRRTKLRRTLFREFPIGINDPIGKPRRHILRVRNHPIETVSCNAIMYFCYRLLDSLVV